MCAYCKEPGVLTCDECGASVCSNHAYYVDRDILCKDCKKEYTKKDKK